MSKKHLLVALGATVVIIMLSLVAIVVTYYTLLFTPALFTEDIGMTSRKAGLWTYDIAMISLGLYALWRFTGRHESSLALLVVIPLLTGFLLYNWDNPYLWFPILFIYTFMMTYRIVRLHTSQQSGSTTPTHA